MSESMSLTRALAEVKLLEKRVAKQSSELQPIAVKVGGKIKQPFQVEETKFKADVQSAWDSITDLIKRRQKIKRALNKANAETEVTIGDQKMTIAEAIDMKSFIKNQENLLNYLRQEKARSNTQIERINEKVNQGLQKLLEQHFSKEGNARPKQEDMQEISEPYLKNNQAALVDPINIDEKIKELQKQIDEFILNVDFSLSEINSKTEITI